MVRGLIRLILVVVIVAAAGAFFLGYRWGDRDAPHEVDRPAATTGSGDIDTSRARETGAAIGEKVAEGANKAQRASASAALTAKIKSKMALDDHVDATAIDVDTNGSVVTLTGRVSSDTERSRALQLARETDGVTSVVDRLSVNR
jgi:hyperosmotically inducible periplasmic protein